MPFKLFSVILLQNFGAVDSAPASAFKLEGWRPPWFSGWKPSGWQPPWAEADARRQFELHTAAQRQARRSLTVSPWPARIAVSSSPRQLPHCVVPVQLSRGIGDCAVCLAVINCLTSKLICALSCCNKRFRWLVRRNRTALFNGYLRDGYISWLETIVFGRPRG